MYPHALSSQNISFACSRIRDRQLRILIPKLLQLIPWFCKLLMPVDRDRPCDICLSELLCFLFSKSFFDAVKHAIQISGGADAQLYHVFQRNILLFFCHSSQSPFFKVSKTSPFCSAIINIIRNPYFLINKR